jgi:3-oxoacyl-[acyl-carrier-protein] synthase III
VIGLLSAAYRLPPQVGRVADWCREQGWSDAQTQSLLDSGADRYHHVDGSNLLERYRALGFTPAQLQAAQSSGVGQYQYAKADHFIALATEAVEDVLQKAGVDRGCVDALVWFNTSQCTVLAPPISTVGRVRAAANLRNSVAFSIAQQNCVSTIHALRVVQALFKAHPQWKHAIVVGADVILREDLRAIGTSGIQTDAASALLIGRTPGAHAIVALETYNDPRLVHGIHGDGRYEQNDNYLWSAISLMRKVMKSARIAPADLASILPHNTNLPGWRHTLDALRIPVEKLFTGNFARIGHAFGSDVAINLVDANAFNRPGNHLVFSSGIAGCFGSFILQCKEPS